MQGFLSWSTSLLLRKKQQPLPTNDYYILPIVVDVNSDYSLKFSVLDLRVTFTLKTTTIDGDVPT